MDWMIFFHVQTVLKNLTIFWIEGNEVVGDLTKYCHLSHLSYSLP